jgi:hypothetical protein
MVAFVGTEVTAVAMLEKWEDCLGPVDERGGALDRLEAYVRWTAAQRLGSVFEAAYDSSGILVARKVADSLPAVRLPIPE